jgi:hypothetical protein
MGRRGHRTNLVVQRVGLVGEQFVERKSDVGVGLLVVCRLVEWLVVVGKVVGLFVLGVVGSLVVCILG